MTYHDEVLKSTQRRFQQNLHAVDSAKAKPHAPVARGLMLAAIAALFPVISSAQTSTYVQTNIVSDGSAPASKTDSNLINPWGIAIGKAFWIDSPGSGFSLIDDALGNQQFTVKVPPAAAASAHGGPTGVVLNTNTSIFPIPNSGAAQFIFGTLDGTIAAWNTTTNPNAVTVVNNSSGHAVYTGVAIDTNATGTFLLAANQIPGGGIDVFDQNFAPAHLAGNFTDPTVPQDFSPFSVHILAGNVYVGFTQINPATGKRVVGPGLGFVRVFDLDGNLIPNAGISAGNLNAPWGVAIAPAGFGSFAGDLLVGNFGDGIINAFDPTSFVLKGQLQDADGNPIANSGLWEIVFGAKNVGDPNTLFFSAGINGTKGGLFGEITLAGPPEGSPDFTVQSNTAALTVNGGQAGSVNFSLAGVNGFSGAASFTCSGLPTGDTCTFNPTSVNVSGSAATTVAVSIATAAPSTHATKRSVRDETNYGAALAFVGPIGMLALIGVRRRSLIVREATMATTLVLLSFALVGCSSSSNKDQTAPPAVPVSTNITINAVSGSITHSLPVVLTVN